MLLVCLFSLLRGFKQIDLCLITSGVRNQQLQLDFNDIFLTATHHDFFFYVVFLYIFLVGMSKVVNAVVL